MHLPHSDDLNIDGCQEMDVDTCQACQIMPALSKESLEDRMAPRKLVAEAHGMVQIVHIQRAEQCEEGQDKKR